jgi:hypothetical protein
MMDLQLLKECHHWMKNREREKVMRAKDNRSYAELFNDIEVLCDDIAKSPLHSTRDDERATNLLTSCYWLFRLSQKNYQPLVEWYTQHKARQSNGHEKSARGMPAH